MISRLSKTVWLSLLLVVVASGVSSAAERGSCECGNDAGAIHARIKGGVGFFSGLGFVTNDPSPAFGLDLGVELGGGFGVVAGGRLILENRSTLNTTTNSIDSRFFSVAPTYSLKKGRARVTGSLAFGILSSSLETFSVSQAVTNTSRFGIAPGVDLDVQIGGGATLNLSFQYLFGTGTEPSPDLLMPMAGIGWEF